MRAFCVVALHPRIDVSLQFVERVIQLASECAGIELVLDRLMEALTDAIGLRVFGFGARVIDVLYRQLELIFVMLTLAAVFGSTIREDAQQRNLLLFKER